VVPNNTGTSDRKGDVQDVDWQTYSAREKKEKIKKKNAWRTRGRQNVDLNANWGIPQERSPA